MAKPEPTLPLRTTAEVTDESQMQALLSEEPAAGAESAEPSGETAAAESGKDVLAEASADAANKVETVTAETSSAEDAAPRSDTSDESDEPAAVAGPSLPPQPLTSSGLVLGGDEELLIEYAGPCILVWLMPRL